MCLKKTEGVFMGRTSWHMWRVDRGSIACIEVFFLNQHLVRVSL